VTDCASQEARFFVVRLSRASFFSKSAFDTLRTILRALLSRSAGEETSFALSGRQAQPIPISLDRNYLASPFGASIGNVVKLISVLRENLCHAVTGSPGFASSTIRRRNLPGTQVAHFPFHTVSTQALARPQREPFMWAGRIKTQQFLAAYLPRSRYLS